MTSSQISEAANTRGTGAAADIIPIDIGVRVQHEEGAPCASWFFAQGDGGGDATRVTLYIGQVCRVTYRLLDATAWRFEAISLRQVSQSPAGFVTLSRGETTSLQRLPANAGTLTVVQVGPDAIVLEVSNALPVGGERLILGLSLTATPLDTPTLPKQSSQDPQMVLESQPPPPPPDVGA